MLEVQMHPQQGRRHPSSPKTLKLQRWLGSGAAPAARAEPHRCVFGASSKAAFQSAPKSARSDWPAKCFARGAKLVRRMAGYPASPNYPTAPNPITSPKFHCRRCLHQAASFCSPLTAPRELQQPANVPGAEHPGRCPCPGEF